MIRTKLARFFESDRSCGWKPASSKKMRDGALRSIPPAVAAIQKPPSPPSLFVEITRLSSFPSGARWELARGNPHETRVTNREITRGQTPSGMYRCGNRPAHGFGIFGRIEWAFGELLG